MTTIPPFPQPVMPPLTTAQMQAVASAMYPGSVQNQPLPKASSRGPFAPLIHPQMRLSDIAVLWSKCIDCFAAERPMQWGREVPSWEVRSGIAEQPSTHFILDPRDHDDVYVMADLAVLGSQPPEPDGSVDPVPYVSKIRLPGLHTSIVHDDALGATFRLLGLDRVMRVDTYEVPRFKDLHARHDGDMLWEVDHWAVRLVLWGQRTQPPGNYAQDTWGLWRTPLRVPDLRPETHADRLAAAHVGKLLMERYPDIRLVKPYHDYCVEEFTVLSDVIQAQMRTAIADDPQF